VEFCQSLLANMRFRDQKGARKQGLCVNQPVLPVHLGPQLTQGTQTFMHL